MNIRPFCSEFLEKVSKYYEIFVFTASCKTYAESIVDLIDPNFEYIENILNRNHCLVTKRGHFIKDLNIIKNRNLEDIVHVDDTISACALNLNNGIPIIRWENDKQDQELKYLADYLVEISSVSDVRVPLKARFNLEGLGLLKREEVLNSYL